MEKSNWVIISIIIVVGIFCFWLVESSYESGMQEGVAYQKCLDDLGYDCTKQAVEEIYLPIEREIDEYVYPLNLEPERALPIFDSEVSKLGEKETNEVIASLTNDILGLTTICYSNGTTSTVVRQ